MVVALPMNELCLNENAVSWREVDGEILALDLGTSTYLSTNATGALLWKFLAAGTSRAELIEHLQAEFDVDEPRAAADVDAFLRGLAAQGLLAG